RAVHGLHRVVGEELAVVGREPRRRVEPLEPSTRGGARVGDVDDPRPDAEVGEVDPPRRGARELAPHQPAADQAEPDDPVGHQPWTIAISRRVMPAGSACWITLRPNTIPAAPRRITSRVRSSTASSDARPPPRTSTARGAAVSSTRG